MLRHSSDDEPGYTRKRTGRAWAYFDDDGKRITDRDEIDRLNAIALAPGLCRRLVLHGRQRPPAGDRHAMRAGASNIATIPTTARKHDASKYDGCREFGDALPRHPRAGRAGPRSAASSTATPCSRRSSACSTSEHIRVGNEEYARDNKSFGATTLRTRHLRRMGGKLKMRFTGKHGIVHEATITDASLEARRQQCQDLPGQMLFQYVNGDGEPQRDHFRRRQRLHPRRDRRRFHRQAFPHLGRERDRLRPAC